MYQVRRGELDLELTESTHVDAARAVLLPFRIRLHFVLVLARALDTLRRRLCRELLRFPSGDDDFTCATPRFRSGTGYQCRTGLRQTESLALAPSETRLNRRGR